jgi:quinol monooxygenase YgiN
MLAIIVEFEVRPAYRAEFEAKLLYDAAETLHDDGCRRMEVLQVRGAPNRLVLSELWRDEAAIEVHRARPGHSHSHAWQEPLIASKRVTAAEVLPSTAGATGR